MDTDPRSTRLQVALARLEYAIGDFGFVSNNPRPESDIDLLISDLIYASRAVQMIIFSPNFKRNELTNVQEKIEDLLNHVAMQNEDSAKYIRIHKCFGRDAKTGAAPMELQRLAAIVDGSDDAIISKTLAGIVSTWNAGAFRLFGYTADEMVRKPISLIIPVELQAEEAAILAKLALGERIDHFDTVRLAKDGRRIEVSLTVSPLRDEVGTVVGASKIARDITRRKELERALRNANDLALRLKLDAEKASQAKTDFLAVMSHEIRTPLNSIHGFVDLLTTSTKLTPQQRRYADLVKTANTALLSIVDDILDFAKVEAGRVDLTSQAFSLSAVIDGVIATMLPAANAKNLLFSAEVGRNVPDWVSGDAGRLRQILLNLLNNAVKFTKRGEIKLSVKQQTKPGAGRKLLFSVTDTGVGVSACQQDRLFEKFSQADSSISREYGGSGLGLAISKRLVELMDGEIGLASEVGRGSTFWFTARLPAVFKPTQRPASNRSHHNSLRRNDRILVVGDIETNLEIVDAYLRDSGYQVECVTSAFDAIQMLGSSHFDLVLMDVQMPVMDCLTATQRIRALPGPTREVPIIAMTGNVLPHQIRACLKAGMNDHVGKPIERAKLNSNVRRWLPKDKLNRVPADAVSADFSEATFNEFVVVVGDEKARKLVEDFLGSLSESFRSSVPDTQKQAHDLLNIAGVLGLKGFVSACRRVLALTSAKAIENRSAEIKELLNAQLMARQLLITRLLPKLQTSSSPKISRSA